LKRPTWLAVNLDKSILIRPTWLAVNLDKSILTRPFWLGHNEISFTIFIHIFSLFIKSKGHRNAGLEFT
jgi:hypothetical protein